MISGTLAEVTDGKLTVISKAADGKPSRTAIPLADIVRISLDDAPLDSAAARPAPGMTLPSAGPGLTARYYNQQFWKGGDPQTTHAYMIHAPDFTTTVPDLQLDWGDGSPDPSIGADHFSSVFSGKVRTTVAGKYTFLGLSDDDHYLFVNGQLVSSDTGGHTPRDPRSVRPEAVTPIELAADSDYDFIYLHNENIGGAAALAMWIPPGQTTATIIPAAQFTTRSGPPAAPADLKVAKSSSTFITLTFRDVAVNETRYTVERSTDERFTNLAVVATVGMNATTATDTRVTGGTTYYYRVKAQNFEGESAAIKIKATAADSADPPASPADPIEKSDAGKFAQPRASSLQVALLLAGAVGPDAPPATQPSLGDDWLLTLVNDDLVRGELLGWNDGSIKIRTGTGTFVFPDKYVREAWRGDGGRIERARAAIPADAKEDVALVERETNEGNAGPQIIAVSGKALGIEPRVLRFQYREQERRIQLGRLAGVQLSPSSRAADEITLFQTYTLANGDQLSGTWTALAENSARVHTLWGQDISLPLSQVKTIVTRNGRLTYLTDIKPAKVEETPYFDRMLSYRVDQSLSGGPLALPGKTIEHGIAVHSRTALHYNTGGKFERLRATAYFEQPAGKNGRADLRILGDGKTIFEQQDARGDRPPIEIDVPMVGVNQLTLVVDFGADEDVGDRVVWANPRLLRAMPPSP